MTLSRAVGRSENPGVPVVIRCGYDMSSLVEIGLTDQPNIGCAMAHPAHPGTTGLLSMDRLANHVDFSACKPIFLLTKTNIHSFEIELY